MEVYVPSEICSIYCLFLFTKRLYRFFFNCAFRNFWDMRNVEKRLLIGNIIEKLDHIRLKCMSGCNFDSAGITDIIKCKLNKLPLCSEAEDLILVGNVSTLITKLF